MDLKGDGGAHYAKALLPLMTRIRRRLLECHGFTEDNWTSCIFTQGDGEKNLQHAMQIVAPGSRYLECTAHAIRSMLTKHFANAFPSVCFGRRVRHECRKKVLQLYYSFVEDFSNAAECGAFIEDLFKLFTDPNVPLASNPSIDAWFDTTLTISILRDYVSPDTATKLTVSEIDMPKANFQSVMDNVIVAFGDIVTYMRRELVPRSDKLCKWAFDELDISAWENHKTTNQVEAQNLNLLRLIPNLASLKSLPNLIEKLVEVTEASNALFHMRLRDVQESEHRTRNQVSQISKAAEEEEQLSKKALVEFSVPNLSLGKVLKSLRYKSGRVVGVSWAQGVATLLSAAEVEPNDFVLEDDEDDVRVQLKTRSPAPPSQRRGHRFLSPTQSPKRSKAGSPKTPLTSPEPNL